MDKTNEFILKANHKHNDKYDYSEVVYVKSKEKVKIKCNIHGTFEQSPSHHLRGTGCPQCCGNVKYTKESFIEAAKKIHGDTYDYVEVVYINSYTKIKIKCNIHGIFLQKPHQHLSGRGCQLCKNKNPLYESKGPLGGTGIQLTTETFIEKANNIHKNKYDYSLVNYINSKTCVTIVCKIHDMFEQVAGQHLCGSGCPNCGKTKKLTTETFIVRAKELHKDKYTYEKVIYVNAQTKVTITCPQHGDFLQTPVHHLKLSGCYTCGKITTANKFKSTKEEFVKKANKIHKNKYNYSKVIYVNNSTNIIIICPKHGEYQQTPQNHLVGKQCSSCAFTNYSKQQIEWLEYVMKHDNIHIQHAENGGEYKIKKYKADGFCKENNTVFEYAGDYHHGNPALYDPEFVNPTNGIKMGKLYQDTLKKENDIRSLGYNLIVIWESEWNLMKKSAKKIQKWWRFIKKMKVLKNKAAKKINKTNKANKKITVPKML
jgi:hypothetical protein